MLSLSPACFPLLIISWELLLAAPPAPRLTFPGREQSPNVRRLSVMQNMKRPSAHSHFTDRQKKKWKTWSERLQRKEMKIQHWNLAAPPLLRAAGASLKHSSPQVFAVSQPTSFPILWEWWSFLTCTLTGREKSWQLNGILQIHHHLSCQGRAL